MIEGKFLYEINIYEKHFELSLKNSLKSSIKAFYGGNRFF
jgi:hypothetical protein